MLAELAAHYQQRDRAARAWRASGGKVVGYAGSDTPVELIEAAGMLPVRVCGDPLGATDLAERYLGPTGDAPLRSLLNRLLDGSYDYLDYLVIARDSEGLVLLFQTLRELQRVEPRGDLPPFCFLDLLHLPYRTSQLYNRDELRRLRQTLAEWSGTPVGDAEVRAAIARRNAQRALFRALRRHRESDPPRVSGVEALQAIGAGLVMPIVEHRRLLHSLLAELDEAPGRDGVRVFMTGSEHEYPDVYAAIEAHGGVVVGEDHDWGDRAFADVVDEQVDPIDALADAYQFGAPASTKYGIAERATYTTDQARAARADVVLAFIRAGDDAPAWDVVHQRRALAEYGIPMEVLVDQPYGGAQRGPLLAALQVTA
jgi:benzoyl-CoA reductase/2-hydroxyglutaryl-CoA dehydratase subunit BcrC/BadD/HgdB